MAEHFVGKLRIGAEHVVELACADRGKRRQIDGGGCIGSDDAEHRERDVDRARANANLQVRRVLQLRGGLVERLLLELTSTGGLFVLFALDDDLFARFDDVALFIGMSEGATYALGGHVLHRPETAITMLVIQQRTQEFIAVEIWPSTSVK